MPPWILHATHAVLLHTRPSWEHCCSVPVPATLPWRPRRPTSLPSPRLTPPRLPAAKPEIGRPGSMQIARPPPCSTSNPGRAATPRRTSVTTGSRTGWRPRWSSAWKSRLKVSSAVWPTSPPIPIPASALARTLAVQARHAPGPARDGLLRAALPTGVSAHAGDRFRAQAGLEPQSSVRTPAPDGRCMLENPTSRRLRWCKPLPAARIASVRRECLQPELPGTAEGADPHPVSKRSGKRTDKRCQVCKPAASLAGERCRPSFRMCASIHRRSKLRAGMRAVNLSGKADSRASPPRMAQPCMATRLGYDHRSACL